MNNNLRYTKIYPLVTILGPVQEASWLAAVCHASAPTCQWGVGEVLQLTALPLAVDDAEVDLGRVAGGRVSVRWHLHKQHVLQHRGRVSFGKGKPKSLARLKLEQKVKKSAALLTGWLLSLSTVASVSQICWPSAKAEKAEKTC